MLKHEGKFKVGDKIKAYHFKPLSDRPDSYLIGTVIDADNWENGFAAYKIAIESDIMAGEEIINRYQDDPIGFVPHEVMFMEYDDRITLA